MWNTSTLSRYPVGLNAPMVPPANPTTPDAVPAPITCSRPVPELEQLAHGPGVESGEWRVETASSEHRALLLNGRNTQTYQPRGYVPQMTIVTSPRQKFRSSCL